MCSRANLQALEGQLRALLALLNEIRIAICEDRPASPDLALLDHRAAALDDLIAQAEEALGHIRTSDSWLDRGDLAKVQRHVNHIQAQLWDDLLSHERISEMTLAARRHGGEWIPWVRSVRDTLRRCPDLLHGIFGALLACWEEDPGGPGHRAVAVVSTGGPPAFRASSTNA